MLLKRAAKLRTLFPHQAKTLEKILSGSLNHWALFFEMRLGKTILCIRLLVAKSKQEPAERHSIMVVAPLSVLEAWVKELSLEGEQFVILQGLNSKKRMELIDWVFSSPENSEQRMWVLSNYDAIRCEPGCAFLPWFSVILDESTAIRNSKAQVTQLCITGFRQVKHRVILSGSPCPESMLDLFNQMVFLYNSFMNETNWYAFRNRYFEINPRNYEWTPKTGMASRIKNLMHEKAFVLRRKELGLYNKKIREVRYIDMLPEQRKLYKQIEDEFAAELFDESGNEKYIETEYAIVKMSWLQRICGGCTPGKSIRDERGKVLQVIAEPKWVWESKYRELLSLLKGELSGEKVIVYFNLNLEVAEVSSRLNKAGISNYTLTGDDNRDSRVRKMNGFRTSAHTNILLCQVKVVTYGVDLSVSSTIITYSKNFSGLTNIQADERIEHPSKKESLLYIDLVMRESVDEDILLAVQDKLSDSKMVMTNFKAALLKRRKAKGARKK